MLSQPFLAVVLVTGFAAAQTEMYRMFIDNVDPNAQWGASVIEACNSSTIYAIVCTSAPLNDACSSGASVSGTSLVYSRLS